MTTQSDSGATAQCPGPGAGRPRRRVGGARGDRRRPRRVRVAYADPGRRLGRRDPGRPRRLDRRGGRGGRDGQGGLGRVRAGRDRRPDGLHRRRGARRRCRRAGSAAGPVAARASRPGAGAAQLPRRPEDAVVRSTDEPHLDGHGPLHGDLGPRARRGRRAGHRARADRPGAPRRAPRRPHPQLLLRHARPGATQRGVPDRARRALGRAVGLGTGRRRPAGDRLGLRLLPAGHPASPPRRPRPGGDRPRRRPLARPRPGLRRPARRGAVSPS